MILRKFYSFLKKCSEFIGQFCRKYILSYFFAKVKNNPTHSEHKNKEKAKEKTETTIAKIIGEKLEEKAPEKDEKVIKKTMFDLKADNIYQELLRLYDSNDVDNIKSIIKMANKNGTEIDLRRVSGSTTIRDLVYESMIENKVEIFKSFLSLFCLDVNYLCEQQVNGFKPSLFIRAMLEPKLFWAAKLLMEKKETDINLAFYLNEQDEKDQKNQYNILLYLIQFSVNSKALEYLIKNAGHLDYDSEYQKSKYPPILQAIFYDNNEALSLLINQKSLKAPYYSVVNINQTKTGIIPSIFAVQHGKEKAYEIMKSHSNFDHQQHEDKVKELAKEPIFYQSDDNLDERIQSLEIKKTNKAAETSDKLETVVKSEISTEVKTIAEEELLRLYDSNDVDNIKSIIEMANKNGTEIDLRRVSGSTTIRDLVYESMIENKVEIFKSFLNLFCLDINYLCEQQVNGFKPSLFIHAMLEPKLFWAAKLLMEKKETDINLTFYLNEQDEKDQKNQYNILLYLIQFSVNSEALEYLIKNAGHLDYDSEYQKSKYPPILQAIFYDNNEALSLLIDQKTSKAPYYSVVNINQTKTGIIPSIFAVQHGKEKAYEIMKSHPNFDHQQHEDKVKELAKEPIFYQSDDNLDERVQSLEIKKTNKAAETSDKLETVVKSEVPVGVKIIAESEIPAEIEKSPETGISTRISVLGEDRAPTLTMETLILAETETSTKAQIPTEVKITNNAEKKDKKIETSFKSTTSLCLDVEDNIITTPERASDLSRNFEHLAKDQVGELFKNLV